jgi:lysophospholipid acyltransferase (LPLAT)-like uncharacterized protein
VSRFGRWAAERWGPPLARVLARSWRMEIIGGERWAAVRQTGRPYVILSWHEALLPVIWQHRQLGIAAIVSEARDGRYLADFALSLGYRIIPGSSSRGATRALRGAIDALRSGIPVGLTPDGPRGPRRELKAGAVVAAQQGNAIIIPVHVEARPAWRAKSWDRFLLPLPGARVRLAYGEPIEVTPAMTRRAIVARLTLELEHVTRLAAWPYGAVTPTG